jgi:thymidylate kinase
LKGIFEVVTLTEQTLSILFEEWDKANIAFCILRNYQSLPQKVEGSDIDILINRSDRKRAEYLLNETAEILGCYIIKPYLSLFGLVHFGLFRLNESIEHLYLDLFYELSWFGGKYLDSAIVLNQRRKCRNFYIPDLEHESYINFMNAVLLGGELKERYIPGVKEASKKSSWANYLKSTFGNEVPSELTENLYQGLRNDLRPLRRSFRSAYLKNRFKSEPTKQLSDLLKLLVNYMSRIFANPGFLLVILGPDGVGKSTIIKGIKKHHKKTKIFSGIYQGHLRPRLLPDLSYFFKKGRSEFDIACSSLENCDLKQEVPGIASSFIRFCYYFVDLSFGYLFKVYPRLLQGKLVIFDRYYYDYFVDIYQRKIGLPWNILKIFSKVIPKPDLVVLLTASPETIIKRKQDVHQIGEIGRQLIKFKKLSDIVPNFAIIENIEKDNTVLSIFRGILSRVKLFL